MRLSYVYGMVFKKRVVSGTSMSAQPGEGTTFQRGDYVYVYNDGEKRRGGDLHQIVEVESGDRLGQPYELKNVDTPYGYANMHAKASDLKLWMRPTYICRHCGAERGYKLKCKSEACKKRRETRKMLVFTVARMRPKP